RFSPDPDPLRASAALALEFTLAPHDSAPEPSLAALFGGVRRASSLALETGPPAGILLLRLVCRQPSADGRYHDPRRLYAGSLGLYDGAGRAPAVVPVLCAGMGSPRRGLSFLLRPAIFPPADRLGAADASECGTARER